MNKKTISLLLITPIICSCHGSNISKDHAKEILTNLSTYLENLNYGEYPVESFERKGETFDGTSKVVTKSIYSMNRMFYYTYKINYPTDNSQVLAEEYWIYGWINGEEYNIYKVFRNNGGGYLPMPGSESMEEKYASLDEFNIAWGEIDKQIKKETIVSNAVSVVNQLNEIITYIEGDEVQVNYKFMSQDNDSIYYDGNYDKDGDAFGKNETIHYFEEYDISSHKLNSFKNKYYGDNESIAKYTNFTYSYNVSEIIYPKIN